jgi:hypothetical protein
MDRNAGFYALIQYGAPERFEFLNVGVALLAPEERYCGIRLARSQSRLNRVFGKSADAYLNDLKTGFANRLKVEFARCDGRIEGIESFAAKRANSMRLSPLLPISIDEPERTLERLFHDLVGEDVSQSRGPRMARRLKDAFRIEGIDGLIDENPQSVELPEFGIEIRAPFGYQNGAYNYIEGLQLSKNKNDAMRDAGKRAMEGHLLAKHSFLKAEKRRLVVVADFKDQPISFYNAVADQMAENQVRLYRIDDLRPLADDIRDNYEAHH